MPPGEISSRMVEPLATQQKATVIVGDGQGIAQPGIAQAKLALEVGTPYIVGCAHAGKWLGMRRRVRSRPPRLDEAVGLEHCADRAPRWPAALPRVAALATMP